MQKLIKPRLFSENTDYVPCRWIGLEEVISDGH
jgi:hypothetical protein